MSEPKRNAKRDEAANPSWLRVAVRRVLPPVALAAFVVGVVFGIILLGRLGRDSLRDHEKYRVAVREIECEHPAALEREAFLDEVQYLAQLPAKLPLLDDDLSDRLHRAFAKHPWVARVDEVRIDPPRKIAVRLRFRTPALAVFWDGRWRAVDRDAILLPQNADTQKLPRFRGNAKAPHGPSGTEWGDPEVAAQAREAADKAAPK